MKNLKKILSIGFLLAISQLSIYPVKHLPRRLKLFRCYLNFITILLTLILFNGVDNSHLNAQNVGINQPNPHASSLLEISSNDKGLLIPHLTTTERNDIPSPATGLIIYNTTTNVLNFWDGDSWELINDKYISNTTASGTPSEGGISISATGTSPDASAILDVKSDGTDKKGFLIPRTITGSISSPAQGLLIYNTANNKFSFYNGTSWQNFCNEYITNTTGVGSFTPSGVSINISSADASAMMELYSSDRGLLIPRMNSDSRNDIISPATGLIIYNTTDNSLDFYNGTEWRQLMYDVPSQPGAISGNNSVCSGDAGEVYSISSVSGATSYTWSVPGGASITGGQGTTSITVDFGTSSGDICVTADNGCGSSTESCQAISVNTPTAQITGTSTACDIVTLTASGGTSYSWSGGNSTNTAVNTFNSSGTYTVTVTDANGCTDTESQAVTVNSATASISGTSTACDVVTLTASGGTNYSWSGGNSTNTAVNTFNSSGTYTVTVTDANGCTDTESQAVTVNTATASISGTSTACDVVTLTASGGTSYSWSGGNSTNTAVNTFTTSGTYTVTVTDANGCSDTESQSVTVNTLSTAPTSISGTTTICNGGNTSLTAVGGTNGTDATYQWYAGGCGSGSVLGTGVSLNVSPTSNTTYYVRRTGTCNTTSCASVTVTVYTLSTAATSASASPNPVCSGSSTTLSVNGGSLGTGASWEWYSGSCGGTHVGSGSPSVSPSSTTTYYVKAEGTCNATACKSVAVTVTSIPAQPGSITGDNSVCSGDAGEVYSISSVSGATSYTWSVPGGASITSGQGSTSITVTWGSTSGNVSVYASNGCGNSSSRTFAVTVYTLSTAATSASASPNPVCSGSSTTLSVNGGSLGAGASWKWYKGSCGGTYVGFGSSKTVSPTSTTTYYVRASGTCNTTACKSVTVTVTFCCGTSTVTFDYSGSSVTYGTVAHNGECWLDRNLGASQVAQAYNDYKAYGDLFQWGRSDDGHQDITWTSSTTGTPVNGTTSTKADDPAHSLFILSIGDWRVTPDGALWNGESADNNPCPSGWRLPTETELDDERKSWVTVDGNTNDYDGAFKSPLKLVIAGERYYGDGVLGRTGVQGRYWSSTPNDPNARYLYFISVAAGMNSRQRGYGFSVRCIKD